MKQGKFLIPLLSVLFFYSCQKDTPDNPASYLDDRGYLTLQVAHKLDSDDFEFNKVVVDDFGTEYLFTRASVYLSQPKIGNESTEEYLLVKPTIEEYSWGRLEAGQYTGLTFNIGVDAAANHSNPANYDVNHPLATQSPSTHWTWNSGYLFIVMEGLFDSDNDDVPDQSFVVHLGKDEMLRTKDLPVNVAVKKRSEFIVKMNIDWTEFMTGLDLLNKNFTHTSDPEMDTLIVNNGPNAFSIP